MSPPPADPDPHPTSLARPGPGVAGGGCVLSHRAFGAFGPVLFRRAESDGAPAMVIMLGEREAVLPLRSLRRQLGIGPDTPDGRMLGRIARALDFVTALAPGDDLPAEVVDGRASWHAEPGDHLVAEARLRLRLLGWLTPGWRGARLTDAQAIRHLDADPAVRRRVRTALDRAAAELGAAGAEEIVARIAALAGELAYIEALRAGLLAPATRLMARLERLPRGTRGDLDRQDMISQVIRLASQGLRAMEAGFAEVDALTDDILTALGRPDATRDAIRARRDMLHRTRRAWEPILRAWAAHDEAGGETPWPLVGRTYQFLAPRYMAVREWLPARPREAPFRPPAAAAGASKARFGQVMQW